MEESKKLKLAVIGVPGITLQVVNRDINDLRRTRRRARRLPVALRCAGYPDALQPSKPEGRGLDLILAMAAKPFLRVQSGPYRLICRKFVDGNSSFPSLKKGQARRIVDRGADNVDLIHVCNRFETPVADSD